MAARQRKRTAAIDETPPSLRARLRSPDGRAWLGVGLDVGLTISLLLLGWAPMFDLVKQHALPAAYGLGLLHIVLVPVAFFLGADDPVLVANSLTKQTLLEKAMGLGFIGFYVLGWLLPVCAYTIAHVPTPLFAATIFVHISPIALALVLVILGAIFGKQIVQSIERVVFGWIGLFTIPVLTVLFASYLALVETFLLLVRERHGSLGGMALPAWAIGYLPVRLFFARLTGLHGPERWTFALSNVHLLARLVLVGAS